MAACKAIAKLLKLNKILKIVDFRFCRDGSLRLDVKPFKNGARCRECGRRSRLVRRKRLVNPGIDGHGSSVVVGLRFSGRRASIASTVSALGSSVNTRRRYA